MFNNGQGNNEGLKKLIRGKMLDNQANWPNKCDWIKYWVEMFKNIC